MVSNEWVAWTAFLVALLAYSPVLIARWESWASRRLAQMSDRALVVLYSIPNRVLELTNLPRRLPGSSWVLVWEFVASWALETRDASRVLM